MRNDFQNAGADPRSSEHYFNDIDAQIARAQTVLDNWQRSAAEINKVRELETPTQIMRDRNLPDEGYWRVQATEGYNRLLNAYKLLNEDRLSPQQNQALERAINIQNGLREDAKKYGELPQGVHAERFVEDKLHQLQTRGEIYMISGHEAHFNITKIKMQPDGSYTYTLYDSGHESNVVRRQQDRAIVHAVREHRIQDGTDMRQFISADVLKKSSAYEGDGYKNTKSFIEGSIEHPPIRTVEDLAQRRGNCSTRGQRIMFADIVQDNALSESMYTFLNGANGTSDADIRQAIENKLNTLETIRNEGRNASLVEPHRQLNFDQYAQAANAHNYEHVAIGLDNGGHAPAYRTKPGVFDYQELEVLQSTLQRNGVGAELRESVSQRGSYYLYVNPEYSENMHGALMRDNSPAAIQYKNLQKITHSAQRTYMGGSDEIISLPSQDLDPVAKEALMNQLRADGFEVADRPNGSTGPNIRVYSSHDQFAAYQERVHNFLVEKATPTPTINPNVSFKDQERFIAGRIFGNTNLGEVNELSLKPDGMVVLTVREDYSRSALADALGMDEGQAAGLRRASANQAGRMEIHIPPESMPKSIRPNLPDMRVAQSAALQAAKLERANTPQNAHIQDQSSADIEKARVAPMSAHDDVMKGGADINIPGSRMSSFGQAGGGAAGAVMAYQGLESALERGDTTGVVISGADLAVSGVDLALDGSAAFGKSVAGGLVSNIGRANIGLMVVDGVYQISQEEGLENKIARGTAVTATTATAMIVGAKAAAVTVAATGTAAVASTAIIVAAPIAAAVAVGMTTDAAVEAYKAENSLDEAIAKSEESVKSRDETELSGAPALQNYQNLKWFTICESDSLMEEGMSRQDAALKAKEHEFSQDPLTLDEIEAELEAKIAEYDQKIEGLDDWWIPNVMEQDDMQEKWAAQIERARYAAALNELQDYREELDDHEAKNTVDLTQRDGLSGAFDTALDNTDESLVATQPEINAPEDDVSLDSISGSFITMSNNNDATTDIRHPTPEQLSARSSHISLDI